QDHVGLALVVGELVALGAQETRDALRVVLVHLTSVRDEMKLCHELSKKSRSCVDLTVAPAIHEVNLARKSSEEAVNSPHRGRGTRGINHDSSAGSAGATSPGRGLGGAVEAPSEKLVDLVRPPSLRRASGLPFPLVVPAVAVTAERERGLHLELALEPIAPLLPPLLVLELVLVERRGLLDAVRQAELDRQL